MYCLDEGDALHFLLVSLEKGNALLQALHIVHYSRAGITRMAYPAANRPSVVAVIEMEFSYRLTTALTKTVLRFRRTIFFWWRRPVTAVNRTQLTSEITNIPAFTFGKLMVRNIRK
jgi:hypothetical protein